MTEESDTTPAFAPPDPSLRVGMDDHDRVVSDPGAPVIIGVSFDSALKAQEYLIAMSRLRQEGVLQLKDAVTVTKQDDGKVAVTETIDPTPGRAALSGGMWLGLLGLFVGGPVGWIAGIGIGAGAGAVAAKVVDLGIPDEWVDWFKDCGRAGNVDRRRARRARPRPRARRGGPPVPRRRTPLHLDVAVGDGPTRRGVRRHRLTLQPLPPTAPARPRGFV